MLNPSLFLNQDIFAEDTAKLKQAPIREGFGKGLLAAGEKDSRVVGLCADLTESTKMNLFRDKFPDRFIEIGVAEQNLASVASGMAALGKIPAITSYAMFSPGRNWEQIRTTICYNDRKVIVAGSHAGISVGPDGGTHQALEDIAITRVMPNMAVISPCDALEAQRATEVSFTDTVKTPAYIRLARDKTPLITTEQTPFTFGKAEVFFLPQDQGAADIGIIVTGGLTYNALKAAQELESEGHRVKVLNVHTIKPLDTNAVHAVAEETGCLVTVEEHQIAGGMGSAIAECVTTHVDRFVPIEFIGVHDKFGQSGTPAELVEHYGMGISGIKKAALAALARKKK